MRPVKDIININGVMYALCHDGTIWCFRPGIEVRSNSTGQMTPITEPEWKEVQPIPESEDEGR